MVMGEEVKEEESLGFFAHEMYFTLDVTPYASSSRPSSKPNMLRPQWRLMPILQLILSFHTGPCSHRSHKPFLHINLWCLTIEYFSASTKPMATLCLDKLSLCMVFGECPGNSNVDK